MKVLSFTLTLRKYQQTKNMIQQFIITYKQTINMVLILIDNNVLQMPDKKIKL